MTITADRPATIKARPAPPRQAVADDQSPHRHEHPGRARADALRTGDALPIGPIGRKVDTLIVSAIADTRRRRAPAWVRWLLNLPPTYTRILVHTQDGRRRTWPAGRRVRVTAPVYGLLEQHQSSRPLYLTGRGR